MIEFTKTFDSEAELMAFLASKQDSEPVKDVPELDIERIKKDVILKERKAFIEFMNRCFTMNNTWTEYYTPKILAGDDLATILLPKANKSGG